ncbi:hypothetical protein [Telmatospirillum sp.]|uniref:hypothetical protein n=1 Tax=Telmatospirillum sp. TaxID=2079197 RepID=UPI00283E1C8D|nr:hypothetical protein [Telmatospirillum sp.]MDR3439569.1 hypothetical protein [Telmatospirillum sp.]
MNAAMTSPLTITFGRQDHPLLWICMCLPMGLVAFFLLLLGFMLFPLGALGYGCIHLARRIFVSPKSGL